MFYLPEYYPIRIKREKDSNVRHRATCPVCGKKNVNIYWQSNQWQCRVCCELEKKLYGGNTNE